MKQLEQRSSLLQGGLLIGDTWLDVSSGGTLEHIYPATGKPKASFPIAGPKESTRPFLRPVPPFLFGGASLPASGETY